MARRLLLLLSLLAVASRGWAGGPAAKKKLHIGALFPMSGDWAGGVACKPAAMMALNDINHKDDILPDYKLKLHPRDSRCSPGLGVKRMYELLYNPPIKSMFLTGCSTVTTFVAQAAKMWNLIVLAYGSSSPALSNRQRFPTFFRTHPSATIQNPTRIKLLRLLGWRKIAVLWQMEEVFTSTFHDLDREAELANITIAVRQSFQKDPSIAIKTLKKADARIIVGLFYEKMARRVFCEAYRQGLYGRKYVWIIIGWYANNWYLQEAGADAGMNCSSSEMLEVVEGHITTESVMWNDRKVVTKSGMTSEVFRTRLKGLLAKEKGIVDEGKITGFQEAPLAYDAVWALALALDKAERRLRARNSSLTRFDYTRRNEVYEEVYRAMNETHFIGVSTAVYFDSSGNRIAWTKIEQMIDGRYHTLGHYHYIDDNLTMVAQPVWKGGRKPRDQQDVVRRRRSVSLGLYVGLCSLAGCVLLLAVACLAFNVRYREHQAIRSSQPLINSLLCVGCCVALLGVFLYGVDRLEGRHAWRVGNATFHLLCHLKLWVLSIGFTLGYGALFSKTWTVYRLATHQKKEAALRIGRWEVYVLLSVLLLIDVVIMAVWQVVDPLYRVERQFAREVDPSDEDIVYQPYSETCSARHGNVWLGLNFGWKGLLLMFGLLLAYETRNVKLVSVSDSRLAGMAVYNVVVLCCITAPVSLIIDHQQNALFAFIAVALCLCAGLSLGLLFVPKFVAVARHPERGYGAADGGSGLGEKSGAGPGGVGSKEEEERHQRLVTENDMLKRQIDECESRIRGMHQGLHERSKARVELTRRQWDSSGRGAARPSLPNSAGSACSAPGAASEAGAGAGSACRSGSPSATSPAVSQVPAPAQEAVAAPRPDSPGSAPRAALAPRLLAVRGGGATEDTLLLETTTSGVFSEMPTTHTTGMAAAAMPDGLSLSETYL